MTWLHTAAHLRVLAALTRQQAAHVLACLRGAAGGRRQPVLPLLLDAASDADDDELIRACIADLGDGHGYRRFGEPVTLLAKLVAWSNPDTFFAHRLAVYRATGGAELVSQRRRRRRGTAGATAPKTLVDQLRTANLATDWETEDAWWRLLDVIEAGFGDSWLLREAVLATPDGLAPTSATGARLDAGAEPGATATWLRHAQHHNDDSPWWLDQSLTDGDSLAARTWLVALTLYPKAHVVQACAARMEAVLASLSAHETATVIATVHRYRSHTAPRRLDLHDPLHHRVMVLSAPAALLLYEVGFDSTRAELAKLIIDKLTDVLTLRADVARLALTAVGEHQARALRPNLFQGTRPQLAQGTLSDARIAPVTVANATRVLSQPGQWPTDLVTTAALILSSELSNLPPLAHVARDNHWFSDG